MQISQSVAYQQKGLFCFVVVLVQHSLFD